MMSSRNIDRICTATLAGRFGLRVGYTDMTNIFDHQELRPSMANAANRPRNLAARKTASAAQGPKRGDES